MSEKLELEGKVALASDRASHITGTPVWIDGAQSLLV